jgi:hypothetical protein
VVSVGVAVVLTRAMAASLLVSDPMEGPLPLPTIFPQSVCHTCAIGVFMLRTGYGVSHFQAVAPLLQRVRVDRTQIPAVLRMVVSGRGQMGGNAHILCKAHGAVIPMNSGLTGQVGHEG